MTDREKLIEASEKIYEKCTFIPDTGCWLWTGSIVTRGYGSIHINGKPRRTHRVMYEARIGKIPEGLVLDHKCRVTGCCNPDHLEPVTVRENTIRGFGPTSQNAKKTHCHMGHLLAGDNLARPHRKTGRYCHQLDIRHKAECRPRRNLDERGA